MFDYPLRFYLLVRRHCEIAANGGLTCATGRTVGTVVRFERQTGASTKASQPDVASKLQEDLATDANRIEQARSACKTVVDCIESLQHSLATLDDLQRSLLACEDGQVVESQTTSVQSQLTSQLASVAGILRKLGNASEKLSRVGATMSRREPTQPFGGFGP